MNQTKQNFKLELDEIVPEYKRKGIIANLFWKRLNVTSKYIKELKPKSILDVGCGSGMLFEHLIEYDAKKVGIDLNENIKDIISEDNFIYQDLLTYNPKTKFDVVCCLDVLEHFEKLPLNKISEFSDNLIISGPTESLLYKIGRLLIKGRWSEESGPGAGAHFWNIIQIEKELEKVGYKLIKSNKIKKFGITLFHVNLYKMRGNKK